MSQVLFAFRWYLVVQLFGLAALPLCLRLLRHLPDRGYALSKPLGLLLAGWAFWLFTSFGWTYNTAGSILAVLFLLAAAGLLLSASTYQQSGLTRPRSWLGQHWRVILVTEAVFALTFIAACGMRAYMPRIETAGGEKWMEIAFLRAILRSHTFPPHDPWLSGFAISYYYFGYVIVAMITRLAAVPPSIAFNLGIGTLFALTCTASFGLVYDLVVALGTPPRRGLRASGGGAILAGLLGPLLVAVMGNLEGLLEVLHAQGVGPAGLWAWLDIHHIDQPPSPVGAGLVPTRFFWWWQASRVLQDYTPWGAEQHVIDEFPAFSFILGDMHPHVLALPFGLLAIALALNLYLRIGASAHQRVGASAHRQVLALRTLIADGPFATWELFVYAICLGGLGFLNTWDFPVYLFVVAAAATLAWLLTSSASRFTLHAARFTFDVSPFTFHALQFSLFFVALLLPGVLLYLPFWIGFQSQAGGLLLNLFNATRLPQFLVMFGPLVAIAALFVALEARRSGVGAGRVLRWTAILALVLLGLLAAVLIAALLLIRLGAIPEQGPAAYLAAWLRGGPIPGLEDVPDAHTLIARSLLSRLLNPWTGLGLIALLVAIALTLRHRASSIGHPAPGSFVLLLFATGALLTLSVEYVYLRDNFGTRMNTVFKFYFQAWVMWGVAGAYALADLVRRPGPRGAAAWRKVGMAAIGLLIGAGLVYPALAVPSRARECGAPPTLDGTAYLAQTQPDDYAAVAWLNENISGAPVILEAPGDRFRAYVYEGRVSALTGLPTLLGWAGHQHQWRGSYDEQARREPDIETLYTSTDPGEVSALLDKYDVSYVYVGPLERARYPASGLAKFANLLDVVYDGTAVTIYRVPSASKTDVQ